MSFTAYAQLRLPQVAEAFTHLGFPAYFRVELSWAKLLGVVLMLAPVPARLKEWAYAGFAIDLASALIAHVSVGDGPEAWGWRRPPACSGRLSYMSSGAACRPRTGEHLTVHRRQVQVTLSAAKIGARRCWSSYMKRPVPVESASALIDEKIKELGDWRGKTLAKVREIIHEADPEIVEEWKWEGDIPGTPVWSHGGIVCTGETYKNVVKMTFAKGAALKDPSGLFNSSLDGNVRRAIDIHEGDKVE